MTDVMEQQQQPLETEDQTPLLAFEDAAKFNVKHPLQHQWTLWFDSPDKKATKANWSENLKQVITLDTVEDFWG